MTYRVKIYTGEYRARQAAANADGAALYFEQHVNAAENPNPDYGLAVVSTNASDRSIQIGRWYAQEAGSRFDVGGPDDTDVGYDRGIKIGGDGNDNLRFTNMPAVLLEPWFASNPEQAAKMNTSDGAEAGAQLLVDTVRRFVPDGELVALSIGHIGKPSAPTDRGAPIAGGGWEAHWSTGVVNMAAHRLRYGDAQQPNKTDTGETATLRFQFGGNEIGSVVIPPVAAGFTLVVDIDFEVTEDA